MGIARYQTTEGGRHMISERVKDLLWRVDKYSYKWWFSQKYGAARAGALQNLREELQWNLVMKDGHLQTYKPYPHTGATNTCEYTAVGKCPSNYLGVKTPC